jgi:hypothetical protein
MIYNVRADQAIYKMGNSMKAAKSTIPRSKATLSGLPHIRRVLAGFIAQRVYLHLHFFKVASMRKNPPKPIHLIYVLLYQPILLESSRLKPTAEQDVIFHQLYIL